MRAIFFTVLSLVLATQTASANVKLSHQSINVVHGETNPVLTVKSDSTTPLVITAKISDLQGEDSANFIVIPTVARLDPEQEVVFRVLPRDGDALEGHPAFMERFIVTTIPARRRANSAEPGTATAQLNINLAYNLPLVYHGASMVHQPWDQLQLVTSEEGVALHNPTSAIIRISGLKTLDDEDLPEVHYNFIAPNSSIALPGAPESIKLRPINYFGFMLPERILTLP